MKGFPKFKSPLVIRPKPKQFVYLLLTLIGYLALQGWRVFRAVTSFDVLTVVTSVLLMAVAVWHVYRVRRYAEADVTEMLPSIIVLGGTIMLTKLIGFLCSLSAFSVPSLLYLLVECAFWCAVIVCSVRAVCGRYKLLVPLLLLFFGFFWAFIRFELRQLDEILVILCHLLFVWFPVDAIVFTSLYVPEDKFNKI